MSMRATTIIRPQSRQEWLEVRKEGIGSSEVATIVGLNPYETPYQLWRRKTGLDAPKTENTAMRNGHLLEDAIAQMWHAETGREIIKRSAIDWIIRDNEKHYLQVSPDRTFWLGESRSPDAKGILECKSTRMKVDPDDLPKNWFSQVQYQLGVAGYELGSLAWLSAGMMGFDFGCKDLAAVPDFYEWEVEEIDRFWIDNILGGKEPDAINPKDVMLKYVRHTDGKVVECSEEVFEEYQELKEVKERLDEMEEKKEALEGKIKMAFGDAEALSYGGSTICTWKAPKAGLTFDSKTFQAEHPDIAKQYMIPRQAARRFLVK